MKRGTYCQNQIDWSEYLNGTATVKTVLWKYDSILGIAFFCPKCKTFACGEKCSKCGQDLNYKAVGQPEYKGKIKWG